MRMCWRTRPEVRKHLSSPEVPCGEFLDGMVQSRPALEHGSLTLPVLGKHVALCLWALTF